MDFLICSDIDGCISTTHKIFTHDTSRGMDGLQISKLYSDHDSYVIGKLKERLVFISKDINVNLAWTQYRGVKFIHSPKGKDKWLDLSTYLKDVGFPKFAYLGDGLQDLYCLLAADYSFVPANASLLLLRELEKVKRAKKVEILTRSGGQGCLEEVVVWLMDSGVLEKNLL